MMIFQKAHSYTPSAAGLVHILPTHPGALLPPLHIWIPVPPSESQTSESTTGISALQELLPLAHRFLIASFSSAVAGLL